MFHFSPYLSSKNFSLKNVASNTTMHTKIGCLILHVKCMLLPSNLNQKWNVLKNADRTAQHQIALNLVILKVVTCGQPDTAR
jgi:replication fork clamp-binding protein CrfC